MSEMKTTCTQSVSVKPDLKQAEWKQTLQRHAEGIAAMACGVLTFGAWMLQDSGMAWTFVLYVLAYCVGGYVKAKEGLVTLYKERELDVNLLMLLAAAGAASIGYWFEGAILIFIFSLSGALENYTMKRSSKDIASLMDIKPETALLYKDGKESQIKIEELNIGDFVIVKPGERIPADGIVREGVSSVNQASITGESIPVEKEVEDSVFAGTLNGEGALIIEVTSGSESSLFSKIIRLVQEAQSEMPPTQQFIERFEGVYAKAVVGITLLLMTVPHYVLGWTWSETLYRAMVFLVVASPCALVASIMPAMLSAISNSARKGVLFKGGAHLENLAGIRAIAFDKTGTLTAGRPEITDVVPLQDYSKEQLLWIAGSIESLSEHPIGRAVTEKAEACGRPLLRPKQLTAVTGFGVVAEFENETWKIGKEAFVDARGKHEMLSKLTQRLEMEGKTVIFIQNDRGIAGVLAVQDTLRPEAKETIAQLKKLGITIVMLTGDKRSTAEAIAVEAGVDEVYAELLPQEKVESVKALRERYGKVAMIGDGVNDAPALATASVGIAMGSAGSDAALDTADLVLMNDDLGKIPTAIRLGKKTGRIIKQNIVFSLGVILLLILSNFAQFLSLPLGVIGHEGSTILVILNGLRLLKS
ncbi:heavy metal translocating P-type ATPase [Aneurinibacillus migulanus]|uniref:ATPase n=1 Tax=Aneurinibacillus migulanus TaxID=47500 RepID=A0A0D1XRV5_ANEMI|nr:ATPase [Aneurinibacillus migulanus]KON95476.1 ATPase [Aneurinibacillus migulanus]GED13453.1 ATPase [Aneurinibacillus migulanus]SDJ05232.1 Cd2+/Zn2+-exporting ATPase [Aneurinibacillus migulanus]